MSFDVSQFRQTPLTAMLTYKNISENIYLRRAALPQTGADPAIPQVDAPCSKVNTSSCHPIQEMMHNSSGRAWHGVIDILKMPSFQMFHRRFEILRLTLCIRQNLQKIRCQGPCSPAHCAACRLAIVAQCYIPLRHGIRSLGGRLKPSHFLVWTRP